MLQVDETNKNIISSVFINNIQNFQQPSRIVGLMSLFIEVCSLCKIIRKETSDESIQFQRNMCKNAYKYCIETIAYYILSQNL